MFTGFWYQTGDVTCLLVSHTQVYLLPPQYALCHSCRLVNQVRTYVPKTVAQLILTYTEAPRPTAVDEYKCQFIQCAV